MRAAVLPLVPLLLLACGGPSAPETPPPPQPKPVTPAAYLATYNADHEAFIAQVQGPMPVDAGQETPVAAAPPPPAEPRPPACVEAKALLDQSNVLLQEAAQATASIRQLDAQIADARANIAREKANPSGVSDLRAMHDEGEIIQMSRDQKKQSEAIARAKMAEVTAIHARAKKSTEACQAAQKK